MPDHVHLIVQPAADSSTIDVVLKAIKRPFSYRIKLSLMQTRSPLLDQLTVRQRPGVTTFRFWQEGPGYDRNLTEPSAIQAAIDYVHENPVRRGLCKRTADWYWSSACSYIQPHSAQKQHLPKIDRLPPGLFDDLV
jgi:putative transposase